MVKKHAAPLAQPDDSDLDTPRTAAFLQEANGRDQYLYELIQKKDSQLEDMKRESAAIVTELREQNHEMMKQMEQMQNEMSVKVDGFMNALKHVVEENRNLQNSLRRDCMKQMKKHDAEVKEMQEQMREANMNTNLMDHRKLAETLAEAESLTQSNEIAMRTQAELVTTDLISMREFVIQQVKAVRLLVDSKNSAEQDPQSKEEQQSRLIAQAHLELHGVKLEVVKVPMIAKEVSAMETRLKGIEQELRLMPRSNHQRHNHHGSQVDHVLKVPESYKTEFRTLNTRMCNLELRMISIEEQMSQLIDMLDIDLSQAVEVIAQERTQTAREHKPTDKPMKLPPFRPPSLSVQQKPQLNNPLGLNLTGLTGNIVEGTKQTVQSAQWSQ